MMTLVQSWGDGNDDGQEIHGSWQKLPRAAAKRHFTCSSKQHRLHPAKSSNTRPLRLTTSHLASLSLESPRGKSSIDLAMAARVLLQRVCSHSPQLPSLPSKNNPAPCHHRLPAKKNLQQNSELRH